MADRPFFLTLKLDEARNGFRIPKAGKYIKVIAVSSGTVNVSLAFDDDNPNAFSTYSRGDLFEGNWDTFYLTNTAQAGEYVTLMVTDGQSRKELEPKGDIYSIETAVKVINDTGNTLNMSDSVAQGKLDGIVNTIKSDTLQRAPLTTLEGATFASASSNTITLATAAANVNGVIIRQAAFECDGNGYDTDVYVDGKPLGCGAALIATATRIFGIHKNIFIPSGKLVELINHGGVLSCGCWYQVL